MTVASLIDGLAVVGTAILVIIVFVGAVPLLVATYQFARVGLHRWHSHLDCARPYLPNIAIVIPAWNEGAVLGASLDRLLAMDYPRESCRLYVVDDASTDNTPDVAREYCERYPGRVVHLRRDRGGQGKAHTLNHGLRHILDDTWADAILIMDADVIYEERALRHMARHLADPRVGAVTAYIKEGSRNPNWMNKFISFEYIAAQAAARRCQNTIGAMACLAGGAQLHSRANLEAIGGRIDTSTLAEDTFTTFRTQLVGNRVVFDGNAVVWAEEPDTIDGLWKQRLRWARGNVQITLQFRNLWFRRSKDHGLGSTLFGLSWFSLFLLPAVMIASSSALLALYVTDPAVAWESFRVMWIVNGISFLFITTFCLMIDIEAARRCWGHAIMFPGLVSLTIIASSCFPRPMHALLTGGLQMLGADETSAITSVALLFVYTWTALCMLVAACAHAVEHRKHGRALSRALVYLGGYGALLCAVSLTSYIKEMRGAEMKWDKTVKTGRVIA